MEVTAAILAGGLGSRLRPAVADRPKVLAPVNGRPYLTYLLDQLVEASVHQVMLLTGHGADQVQQTLGHTYGGIRLLYSPEPKPLGTAGAIRRALPKLISPVVLVMNGDSFCEVNLTAFLRFHERRAADLSLVVTEAADACRCGTVTITRGGRLLRFAEKTPEAAPGWINAGVYLLDRNLIAEIPSGRSVSLESDMIPAWIKGKKQVFGYRSAGRFVDIGTPLCYAEADTFFTHSGKG
jgi:NDP-sugar pyrophosphorylase family protein